MPDELVAVDHASNSRAPSADRGKGKPAALRFIEFFTGNVRNPSTRAAYGRAGRVEVAQRMAGHSHAKAIGLDDWRNYDASLGEAERVGI
jgi:hypothetical protein